ncbi:hypothetical protein BH24ACT10_BH24ACT10_19110 [soil metagenome]
MRTSRGLVAGLVAAAGLFAYVSTGSEHVQPTVAAADDEPTAVPSMPAPSQPAPSQPAPSQPAPSQPAPAPAAPASPSPAAGQPVTLAFGGDVHAEGGSGGALRAGLPAVRDLLGGADVAVLNLETAVTEGGTRADKEFAYRAPASVLTQLKDAGVDVVTLANNHGLDYGRDGLRDTLAASAATGLPVVGIGLDEDQAYAPHVVEVRGQRIAVLGATQVLDSNLGAAWTAGPGTPGLASAKREERLVQEVARAREQADTVVVYLHWGRELDPCPLPRQQDLARQLVAAGADVVVGSHAHVLLGGGWLDGAYVDYGLGNFVFGARRAETSRTGVLTLSVSGRSVTAAQWTPARVRSGAPTLLTGAQAEEAVADKDRRRGCTDLSAAP